MKVKEACNEVDLNIFVNNANFTFWNGGVDDAALKRDGLHLSESGVGRLLLNLSLPEQPPKHYKRQHQQQQLRRVSRTTIDRQTSGTWQYIDSGQKSYS